MIRAAAVLLLAAAPAAAWEFTPSPVCTLSHATDEAEMRVTYDPRAAEPYEMNVTASDAPLPDAPVFSVEFAGPSALTISTNRHRRDPAGGTLSVSDTGFGNVLDGLEFSATAVAVLGERRIPFPLAGAASEVRKFRACTEAPTA